MGFLEGKQGVDREKRAIRKFPAGLRGVLGERLSPPDLGQYALKPGVSFLLNRLTQGTRHRLYSKLVCSLHARDVEIP
jgi:hypothetical protein